MTACWHAAAGFLAVEGVLDLLAGLLDVGLGLLCSAFGFLSLVVGQLAGLLLGLAAKLLGLVAQLVLRIAHAITSRDPAGVPDTAGSNPGPAQLAVPRGRSTCTDTFSG